MLNKSVQEMSLFDPTSNFSQRYSQALGLSPLPKIQRESSDLSEFSDSQSVASVKENKKNKKDKKDEKDENPELEKTTGPTYSPLVKEQFLPKLTKIPHSTLPKKKEQSLSNFPEIFKDFDQLVRPELAEIRGSKQPTKLDPLPRPPSKQNSTTSHSTVNSNRFTNPKDPKAASNFISKQINETIAESRKDRQMFGFGSGSGPSSSTSRESTINNYQAGILR